MKAYFKGLIEICAENLKLNEWMHPSEVPLMISLDFQYQCNGFLYWTGVSYLAVNKPLFNYVYRYAAKRGVPIFVEP